MTKDLYELIDKYKVPVPPEDYTYAFNMLKPAVQGLRSSVDRVMSQREQYIDKFCRFLDKDIVALRKELKGVKNEAQVLKYIYTDIYSISVHVHVFLCLVVHVLYYICLNLKINFIMHMVIPFFFSFLLF